MTQATRSIDWNTVVDTPLSRLRAVADYAKLVFGDETLAATWLSRAHREVRGGLCAVGAACQSAEGFRESVSELARLERLGRVQANEVAHARPWLVAADKTSRSASAR